MSKAFDPARGLAGLIDPVTPERFFSEHWDARALHAPGDTDFSGLISTARIDALIASQVFHAESLSMARSQPRIAPQAYLTDSGQADRGLVVRSYQEGATLILPQLHRREAALADFCRMLEAEFGHPMQTNIYLTPPTAQGFQTHYDTHDVFILQVEGAKRWRLYDAPAGAVFRGEGFEPGAIKAGPPTLDVVLTQGDVLYVPRGLMHDAINDGDEIASLHITAGVLAKTWADFLLEAVSEAALKTPALRQMLPAHVTSDAPDLAALRSVFDSSLEQVRERADLDAVAALFADRFVTGRIADTTGALLAGAGARHASVRRRARIPLHLAEDGDHVAILAPGGPVSFDAPARSGLERLLTGATVSAADFAALGKDKARDAVARLVAFGLAEPV